MVKRIFFAAVALLTLLCAPFAAAENLPPFKAEPPGPADFSGMKLKTPGGAPVSLADFSGKVLLLNFASTWCVACYAEMPALNRLYAAYRGKGLAVVAVLVHDGGPAKAEKFAEKTAARFPVLIEEETGVMARLGLSELPVSYILDKKGIAVAKVSGAVAWDGPEAASYFEELLGR
ncbi:MAG: TlpA family protein disulfide reductase [Nitrospinae bacterium]|nr:TlpA family protein disulfide reductase [Nitrospinota bacterium]